MSLRLVIATRVSSSSSSSFLPTITSQHASFSLKNIRRHGEKKSRLVSFLICQAFITFQPHGVFLSVDLGLVRPGTPWDWPSLQTQVSSYAIESDSWGTLL
ncbi:hypothetical protein VN97_g1604 [Penicillium thymicola]|uniref:Uncharacterized protein n=1 Tax=Penicillium thymicola TaxID=293382 RepID=A0AAI9TQU3_PENTH|nr:hypothetical protein VN97_g1604 [Penicillium thymicola]